LWASNWLQKIEDPDVYSQFSKEREEGIKKRRKTDAVFDEHMKKVRSEATKNRKEGYQKEAGIKFKKKMLQQSEYSDRIRSNRQLSNAASLKVRRGASEEKAKQVIAMRNSGCKYSKIQKETGYSLGAISLIVNKKMMASVTETGSAQVS
jgi:hypothetical protein